MIPGDHTKLEGHDRSPSVEEKIKTLKEDRTLAVAPDVSL